MKHITKLRGYQVTKSLLIKTVILTL